MQRRIQRVQIFVTMLSETGGNLQHQLAHFAKRCAQVKLFWPQVWMAVLWITINKFRVVCRHVKNRIGIK